MIKVPVKIKLPFLWGKAVFKKENWSQVNVIVGPNGSGKTLIANQLAHQFANAGYSVRLFNTDLIDEEDIYYSLNKNEKIRTKIEDILSTMFAKEIRFEKGSDNSIIPVAVNKTHGIEYSITKDECHGLKKIIALLSTLYVEEQNANCLMIDEPELHLHPQFQNFFMSEIRRLAKENPTRLFFIATHSPFFIDLKSPDELLGVIVCHINSVATSIDKLSENDYLLFKKFLPRFNSYHKQFFFSDNQIFVEGYTDQQILSTILTNLGFPYNSSGTGIIDVGGKDELGVFFKVCSLLGTNARIITDLDSLFCGKLEDSICKDKRVQQWLDKQVEKQQLFLMNIFSSNTDRISFGRLISRLEKYLLDIAELILENDSVLPLELQDLKNRLEKFNAERDDTEHLDTYKVVILQGILSIGEYITKFILKENSAIIHNVKNLFSLILAAAEASRVYVLPGGAIEHFYTQNKVSYMPISGKDKLFHEEFEYLQNLNSEEIKSKYPELTSIIKKACSKL